MNLGQPYVVFSVYQSNLDEATNKSNHSTVIKELSDRGVGFKEINAQFNNKPERNLLIDVIELYAIEKYLKKYNQTCTVLVYGDRYAELKDLNGSTVRPLGYVKEVSKIEAQTENHFEDQTRNLFWAFRK